MLGLNRSLLTSFVVDFVFWGCRYCNCRRNKNGYIEEGAPSYTEVLAGQKQHPTVSNSAQGQYVKDNETPVGSAAKMSISKNLK